MKVATWNVRTLFQNGKFDNVKQEMTRMRINILGMCEVRWTGAGLITSDEYTVINTQVDTNTKDELAYC